MPEANKVIITSISAKFFANYLAEIAGGEFIEMMLKNFADLSAGRDVLFLGYYHPEMPVWDAIKPGKAVLLFAGYDITQLRMLSPKKRSARITVLMDKGIQFAVEAEHLIPYVESRIGVGVKVQKVLHLPSPHRFSETIPEFPEQFTVGCYMPQTREAYYQEAVVLEAARLLPDVKFIMYSLKGWSGRLPAAPRNVVFLPDPVKDMEKFISGLSCGLRLPLEDTYSMTLIEYCMMGRRFVTNHFAPGVLVIPLIPSAQEVANHICIAQWLGGPDLALAKSYREKHDQSRFGEAVKGLLS